MTRVGGFFSCELDRAAFYAQEVPLYPEQYQRWLIALQRPDDLNLDTLRAAVLQWFYTVGKQAGIRAELGGNLLALEVLGASLTLPNLQREGVRQVVYPLPTIKASPLSSSPSTSLIYVSVQFWYDGSATAAPWPWLSRGFTIRCPEDAISGLIAVMEPYTPPEAPPNTIEQMASEAVERVVENISHTSTGRAVVSTTKLVLWGAAGLVLWNVYQATRPRNRA